MSDISSQITQIRSRIDAACKANGREPEDVRLLAVSKTKPVSMVKEAMRAGQIDFGENYLQDALAKTEVLPDASWHFIGAIQSNKTREIANHFDWVHSVASEKVARRLSEQRDPGKKPLKLLVQVNTSRETQKSGVSPDAALDLVKYMAGLANIEPVGLMTIPAASSGTSTQQRPFRELREILEQIQKDISDAGFRELSMGMTGDFEAAIAEGATWIRIGTAIFGSRT